MPDDQQLVAGVQRIGKILAHFLLREMDEAEPKEKVAILRSCGFSNVEIAEMLQMPVGTVRKTPSVQDSK